MEKKIKCGFEYVMYAMSCFYKNTSKKQVFEIYAKLKILPRELLESFYYKRFIRLQPTKEQKREDTLNAIKIKINSITDIITQPFRKEKSDNEQMIGEFGRTYYI